MGTSVGVCTSCSATVACSTGVLPTATTNQVGTCATATGICTFGSTCTNNNDCVQSYLCVDNAAAGSTTTDLNCAQCVDGSSTVSCANGTYAANDLKQTGTCTSGTCTYVQSCTDNSNCAASNLCAAGVCSDACTDDASCMTGTASADDWEGTCNTTTGLCTFEETGLSGGAIAGIVIGSVVFVLLVVVGIYFCTKQSGETDSSKAVAYETLHENH